jgi:hypothetical protein
MKLLLHICCGPCSIYPIRVLRENCFALSGFFSGGNIHPYTECLKRLDTLRTYAEQIELPLIVDQTYDLEGFLRNTTFRETERCRFCYYDRLTATAQIAKQEGFDTFSTTLLYSKYQKHDLIRAVGERVSQESGVPFHYQDFRPGWKEGVVLSKELGMYRQQYCGCIYSEKERYFGARARSRQEAARSSV